MKLKIIQGIFFTVILVSVSWSTFTFLIEGYSLEVDEISYASYIIDGDTFDTGRGDRIRLADIDAPEEGELGYQEAMNALSIMIKNKKVYLDIDDVGRTDRYGRLVCLVYVDYNSTHYLNVNEALLVGDFAEVWDHPNEFDPFTWTIFVSKRRSEVLLQLFLISIGAGLFVSITVYYVLRKMTNIILFRARR